MKIESSHALWRGLPAQAPANKTFWSAHKQVRDTIDFPLDADSISFHLRTLFSTIREKFVSRFYTEDPALYSRFQECFNKRIPELFSPELLKDIHGEQWKAVILFSINDRVFGTYYGILRREHLKKFSQRTTAAMQKALSQHAVHLKMDDKIAIEALIPENGRHRRHLFSFYLSEAPYQPNTVFRSSTSLEQLPEDDLRLIEVAIDDKKMMEPIRKFLSALAHKA